MVLSAHSVLCFSVLLFAKVNSIPPIIAYKYIIILDDRATVKAFVCERPKKIKLRVKKPSLIPREPILIGIYNIINNKNNIKSRSIR